MRIKSSTIIAGLKYCRRFSGQLAKRAGTTKTGIVMLGGIDYVSELVYYGVATKKPLLSDFTMSLI
jgi:hypothetical protein